MRRSGNKTAPATLYLRHKSGATHALSGTRARKLRNELAEDRAGPEITALTLAGYDGFMGPDGETWDFEGLRPEHFR